MSLHIKKTRTIKPLRAIDNFELSDSEELEDIEYCNEKLQVFKRSNFPLSVKIIGSEEIKGAKKAVFYRLQVHAMNQYYSLDKRYTDFKELHDTLTANEEKYSFKDFPGKTFFNLFGSKDISKRTEKFSQMLHILTSTYQNFDDVDFLRWLEIDTHIVMQHHSRPKKQPKRLSGSFSLLSSFIDSEKTSELRNILLDLESGSDVSNCLNDMEKFIFESKKPFPRQGISRFLIGDCETMGFLAYSLTKQDECHYRCSLALNTLCNILDRGTNPQAEVFIKVATSIPVCSFSKLCFADHIAAKGMKKCKDLSLKVLHIFLKENPLIKPQRIIGLALAKEYNKWLQSKLQEPSAAYYLPQHQGKAEDWPNCKPEEYLDREMALRSQDNQEINTDINQRSMRLALFRDQARVNSLHLAKCRGLLRTAYKELELVNHEMIFMSINGTSSGRKPALDSPLKKGVKKAVHDAENQVVELCIVDGKTEYQTCVQYRLKAQPNHATRVYHICSLSHEAAAQHQFNSMPTKSERKHSNNLSLSTNCDDSIEQNSPTRTVQCLFDGELRLTFAKGAKLDWIELSLIALTRDTSKFFSLRELAEIGLSELIGDMLVN